MSVNKLICRVVTPDLNEYHEDPNEVAARIHNFTHGITSDPLAILALVFSALIHDVDHQGVSNLQLSKEEPEMGEHYHQKSIAEQNSLDVSSTFKLISFRPHKVISPIPTLGRMGYSNVVRI